MSSSLTGVSVVMPVHNAGVYLSAAVNSILEQTHRTLELIIIDDHSNDSAIDAVLAQSSDQRIRVLTSKEKGIIPALNLGIQAAAYPMIARMDGDDIAHPERIEQQLIYLQDRPDIQIAGARVELFSDDRSIDQGYVIYQDWINSLCKHEDIAREFFIESAIPHPTAMFAKTTFEQLGGYQDHGWPEDYDLWCRAFLAGLKFGKPKGEPLLQWRDHSPRASRNQARYAKNAFIACKGHYLAQYLRQGLGIEQCSIWGTGPTGLKLHDELVKNSVEVTDFIDIHPKFKGRTKRNKPIQVVDVSHPISIETKESLNFIIAAVSARGAREELRQWFSENGLIEGENYLFAA